MQRAGRATDNTALPAGLPTDQLSVENALVITQSIRTVFIIDPSSQAPNWLQAHMQAQKALFETATMHDERCALHRTCLHCQSRWYCTCSDWLLLVKSGACQLQVPDQICASHASPVLNLDEVCMPVGSGLGEAGCARCQDC